MDVRKNLIDIATGEPQGEVRHYGTIGGELAALARVVHKLKSPGKALVLVYEAGLFGRSSSPPLKRRFRRCASTSVSAPTCRWRTCSMAGRC